MKLKKSDGFIGDDLPERYVAALMLLAEEYEISVEEAHQGVSELLAEIDIDLTLDNPRKPNTKH